MRFGWMKEYDRSSRNRYCRNGFEHIKESKFEKAIESFKLAVDVDSKYKLAWSGMAKSYLKLKEYKKAIDCYKEVIEKDPNNAAVWNNFGIALNGLGKYEEAIKSDKRAVDLKPKKAIYLHNLAVPYFNLKDYNNAIIYLEKALNLYENKGQNLTNECNFYQLLALSYFNLKNYDKAIKYNKKIIDLKPNDALAFNRIGACYHNLGDFKTVIEFYEKSIELSTWDNINCLKDSDLALTWLNLGKVYKNKIKYEEACKCFKKAIEIQPNLPEAWYHLGNVYDLVKHKYKKAIECFNKAIELDKKHINSWIEMGDCYNKLKQFREAIECSKVIFKLSPNNAADRIISTKILHAAKKEENKQLKELKAKLTKFMEKGEELEVYDKALKLINKSPFVSDLKQKIKEIKLKSDDIVSIEIKRMMDRAKELIKELKFDKTINIYGRIISKAKSMYDNKLKDNFIADIELKTKQARISKIKSTILNLGTKYGRLQIKEIAEECRENDSLIESTVIEMIKLNEIYAKYFDSSKAVAFDLQANIDDIDKLMGKYKEWEKEDKDKI